MTQWDNYSHEDRLSLRVPNGFKDAFEAASKRQGRTMSKQAVMILAEWLDEQGLELKTERVVPGTSVFEETLAVLDDAGFPEVERSADPILEGPTDEQVSSDPRRGAGADVVDLFAPREMRATSVELVPEEDDELGPTLTLQMMAAEGEDQNDMLAYVLENFQCDVCPGCGHEDESLGGDGLRTRFFSIVNPGGWVKCVGCRQKFYPGMDFPEN